MNKTLGKILLLLTIPILLFSDIKQVEFTLSANKTSAYIKEALEITFVANQLDHTDVMFFFLEPIKSEEYEIKLLHKKTTELSYHNYTTTFTYLLFPLKAKHILVDFDFVIKVASDEAIAQVYQGGRDNTKWIDTIDRHIPIKPLNIDVKELPKDIDLVGDFTLNSKLLKSEITQYDAANITYKLTGTGYKNKDLNIINDIKNTTIFSQINDSSNTLTKDGYKISRQFNYAIVSKETFTIPIVELKAFSPKKNRFYTLKSDAKEIKVTKLDISSLTDEKDSPKEEHINSEFLQNIITAILIFLSGYFTAKFEPYLIFKVKKSARFQDIKEAKDENSLILILLNSYNKKDISVFVDELERLKYKKSTKSFEQIKTLILEEFR
jgi:hypothetical protein